MASKSAEAARISFRSASCSGEPLISWPRKNSASSAARTAATTFSGSDSLSAAAQRFFHADEEKIQHARCSPKWANAEVSRKLLGVATLCDGSGSRTSAKEFPVLAIPRPGFPLKLTLHYPGIIVWLPNSILNTHIASYGSDVRLSRETGLANGSGQANSCFFSLAPANIGRDDGFSSAFAHCEVESFVELDGLPNFGFACGRASIQNAKRSAIRK